MRRIRVRWYWPLVLAFLILIAFNLQKLLRAEPPTAPRAGDVAAAERVAQSPPGTSDERDRPPPAGSISGNGVIEPAEPETKVGAALAGRIAAVAVREGQKVAAGDVLVEFEQEVEKAALAAAVADVAAARAQLQRSVRGNRSEDVAAALADADNVRARAELSRGVLERLEQVQRGGGATVDEVERARRQAEADAAAARASESRRQAVVAGSRREDVELARAQLAAAESRRDQAQAALDRLTVRAPVAGEVLQVKYRVGEYYQPGSDPLITLGDTSQIRVRMDVDERDIGRVQLGAPMIVRANAFPGVDFTGKVVEIGRRMGRKNVRTDDPTERNDTKILEIVGLLDTPDGAPSGSSDGTPGLIVGQRVTSYIVGHVLAQAGAAASPAPAASTSAP
jgi:HlyD family secretion protein